MTRRPLARVTEVAFWKQLQDMDPKIQEFRIQLCKGVIAEIEVTIFNRLGVTYFQNWNIFGNPLLCVLPLLSEGA